MGVFFFFGLSEVIFVTSTKLMLLEVHILSSFSYDSTVRRIFLSITIDNGVYFVNFEKVNAVRSHTSFLVFL